MRVYKHISNLFRIIAISYLLTTCVDRFNLPEGNYTDLLVVEGFVTNQGGSYVKLSRTIPLQSSIPNPESHATVVISDEIGAQLVFQEKEDEPGLYTYPGNDFDPVGGSIYQLDVSTTRNELIRSSPVVMRETPDMDSVHWEEVEKAIIDGTEYGVDILVTTHDPANSTWYYKWTWSETWHFTSAYYSQYVYDNGAYNFRMEDIYNCWRTEQSTNVIIGTSTHLTEDRVSAFPVHYVSGRETNRLRIKYSILVSQASLSEDAYQYWETMKKVNENVGTLFDPQPAQVYGNLINVNDPDKPVLGYFDCATTKQQRIFISRGQLENARPPSDYEHCRKDTVLFADIPDWDSVGHLLIDEVADADGNQIGYFMSSEGCVDCRVVGTTEKPDFWQ
jgi:hypothetical protein